MNKGRKIIIDTDIGDDIDDAIALYAAMRQKFEIVGITTVFNNTEQRARMVKKLLLEYGNGYGNVPVYAGFGTPIAKDSCNRSDIPHYTSDLEQEIYAPDGKVPEDAIDFIIDACYRYGKDLTVVAIGPFTNLARVIERDTEALNRIEKVVIMGGAYFKQYADWNVLCDVEAADVMFRGVDRLECIGADVTHLTVAEDALYDTLLAYKGSEPARLYLCKLCNMWRRICPHADFVMHDPLVIYYLADSTICTVQEASVAVIKEGYARALTLNVDAYGKKSYHPDEYRNFDGDHKALVASGVDLDVFNMRILRDFLEF